MGMSYASTKQYFANRSERLFPPSNVHLYLRKIRKLRRINVVQHLQQRASSELASPEIRFEFGQMPLFGGIFLSDHPVQNVG